MWMSDFARLGGKRSQADCAAADVKTARTSFSDDVTSRRCECGFMHGKRKAQRMQERSARDMPARDRTRRDLCAIARGKISVGEIVSVAVFVGDVALRPRALRSVRFSDERVTSHCDDALNARHRNACGYGFTLPLSSCNAGLNGMSGGGRASAG